MTAAEVVSYDEHTGIIEQITPPEDAQLTPTELAEVNATGAVQIVHPVVGWFGSGNKPYTHLVTVDDPDVGGTFLARIVNKRA